MSEIMLALVTGSSPTANKKHSGKYLLKKTKFFFPPVVLGHLSDSALLAPVSSGTQVNNTELMSGTEGGHV